MLPNATAPWAMEAAPAYTSTTRRSGWVGRDRDEERKKSSRQQDRRD
jgi:hypothetical protein